MLLSIFLTLLVLTLVFIVIGFYNDRPYLLGLGYIFLFILGLVLAGITSAVIPPGIQYKSGETTDTTTPNIAVQTDTYTTFTNWTIGYFFAIASILAFIQMLIEYRADEENHI